MSNPASINDLEDRWQPLTDQQATNAEAFLDDAWWMLLGRRPNLEADMAAGAVAEGNVIRVLCAMVLRVLKNPDGYLEEAIDDWRGRRDSLVSGGVLTITDDELADVTPGRRRRRSIRLVTYGDA